VDRFWLKSYPPGMQAEIDADLVESVPGLLEKIATKVADRPALHDLGRTLTYAELARLSRDFAAFLQKLPGLTKGERVAIMAPKLPRHVEFRESLPKTPIGKVLRRELRGTPKP
jgi:long-chain acyl-CoA synthetase